MPDPVFGPPLVLLRALWVLFGRSWALPKPFKNQPIFGPSQNRPRGVSQSTLGRPGSTLASKKEVFGAIWEVIFGYCFDTFPSALKTRKRNTYITLGGFWYPKTSPFWINFRSLFGIISGPPSGGAFWPFLARPSADLSSPGRFWTPFWIPLGSEIDPWSVQDRPGGSKKAGPPSYGLGPGAALDASRTRPALQKGPGGHFYRFCTYLDGFGIDFGRILDRFQWIRGRFGTDLGESWMLDRYTKERRTAPRSWPGGMRGAIE